MRSLLTAYFSFIWIVLYSQQYPVESYTVTEGLIQDQVTALAQDHRGNIWIGTKGGISIFDGDSFANFGSAPLTEGIVKDFQIDQNGNVWILTTYGLTKYDYTDFHTYDFSDSLVLNSIAIDNQGVVWMSTRGKGGLYRFDGRTCHRVSTGISFSGKELYTDMEYDPIYDRLLIGSTERGLIEYKNNSFIIKSIDSLNISRVILKDSITYFKSDSTIFKLEGDKISTFYEPPFRLTYRMDIDRSGSIIAWKDEKLLSIDLSGAVYTYNIAAETVVQLMVDRENFIWLGTENGIRRLGSKAFTNYTKNEGIIPNVWTVVEDRAGYFWVGGYAAGLFKFDGKRFINQRSKYSKFYPDRNFHFGAIKDSKDNLLFPTDRHVLKYDGKAFSILAGTNMDLYQDSTNKRNGVFHIFEDTIENTYLLGRAGLQILDKNGEIAFYDPGNGLGIKSYITSINKDKYADYWIGHHKGVSRFDRKNSRFINYYQEDSTNHLPAEGVFTLFRDYKDNIWVGSKNGLLFYDYSTEKFRTVGIDCYNSEVAFIESVDSSYLLLGTGTSIALFDLQKYYNAGLAEFSFFNRKNGFAGGAVGMNAILKDSKDRFWIPTSSLMTRFDPKKTNLRERAIIKPYIIRANIPDSDFESGWRNILERDQKIVLPKNQNNLKIEFKAVSFSNPNIKYRYRLLRNGKVNQDWNRASERTYAIFSNLRKGNYRFEVSTACCFQDGQMDSFVFRVSVNWQKMAIYSFLISAFLLIGILYLIFQTRRNIIEKEKLELKNDNLNLSALQSQMNPHFIFNTLNSIQTILFSGDKRQANRYMQNLSKLIRAFLEVSRSKTIRIKEEINLLKLYIEFEQLRFNNFESKIIVEEQVNLDFKIPPMLLQPYVENAINHGLQFKEGSGLLKINLKEEKDRLIFIVEDDGIGRLEAGKMKQTHKGKYKAHGTQIIQEKVDILKKLKEFDIQIETIDLFSEEDTPTGTKVVLSILKTHTRNDEGSSH